MTLDEAAKQWREAVAETKRCHAARTAAEGALDQTMRALKIAWDAEAAAKQAVEMIALNVGVGEYANL